MDVYLFLSLPFELQQNIIGQNLKLLCSFYQVNQFYNQLLLIVYYNNYRLLVTKNHEFKKVWVNRPIVVEFCSYYTDYGIYFLLDFAFNFNGCHSFIELYLNKNNQVNYNDVTHKKGFYLIDNKTSENKAYISHDLLTLYHLLNNRTQCVKINKNYAKQTIMDDLNYTWDNFIKVESKKLHQKMIEIYFYLMMNIYTFNIKHNTNYKLLLDINQNYQMLCDELTLMYTKIKDAIHKL
jgi:hypothetical protein